MNTHESDRNYRTTTSPDILPGGLSVVIPVYNSQDSLPQLVDRLAAVLPACAAAFELVLVDDCSRDGSWKAIKSMAARNRWVRGIRLMRNFGQHNALLCGIRQAQYEIVATMDDDLQHPPEELPKLLAKLNEGYDVVYGPAQHERHGLFRDVASQVTKLALKSAVGASTARQVSAFRVFRKAVTEAFRNYSGPFVSIDVLLTWGSTCFAAVAVRHDPRKTGVSNYTFRKLMTHALNMVTGFSVLPLQLASMMGFGFTLLGIGVLIYVVGRYLVLGYSVPGFPFLASIIAIFAGAQLFALGTIGEYLARMHFRLMERPSYAIRELTSQPEHKSA
jgi:undecaprenyl-phosphate 4-deoxy-4-formamido-L-arabinose transferase